MTNNCVNHQLSLNIKLLGEGSHMSLLYLQDYNTTPNVERMGKHRPTQICDEIQFLFWSMRAARIKLMTT